MSLTQMRTRSPRNPGRFADTMEISERRPSWTCAYRTFHALDICLSSTISSMYFDDSSFSITGFSFWAQVLPRSFGCLVCIPDRETAGEPEPSQYWPVLLAVVRSCRTCRGEGSTAGAGIRVASPPSTWRWRCSCASPARCFRQLDITESRVLDDWPWSIGLTMV